MELILAHGVLSNILSQFIINSPIIAYAAEIVILLGMFSSWVIRVGLRKVALQVPCSNQ